MRKATRTLALVAPLLVGAAGVAEAASFGNPVNVNRQGVFVVGLETEHVTTPIGDDQADSDRYLMKGTYRVMPGVSLIVRAGAGDIDVVGEIAGNAVALNTNPRFAWGGGIRVEPLRFSSSPSAPRLVMSAEGLHMLSSGEGEMDLVFPSAVLRERFETDYKWREFQGTAALVFNTERFVPYCGLTFRGVDGEVRRVQTDLSGTTPSIVTDERESFGSSIAPYALAGLDYRVGPYFNVSTEAFYRDGEDYGFFVGFSEAND
jgi:hypothetical protein